MINNLFIKQKKKKISYDRKNEKAKIKVHDLVFGAQKDILRISRQSQCLGRIILCLEKNDVSAYICCISQSIPVPDHWKPIINLYSVKKHSCKLTKSFENAQIYFCCHFMPRDLLLTRAS